MNFPNIFKTKPIQPVEQKYHLPHRTSFCLQFLFDAGYTPVVLQQTGSTDFTKFDVYKAITNNSMLILTPVDEVIPNLSDLSFRTGFEFDSSKKLRRTAYPEVSRATYRGERLVLGDSRANQDMLYFAIYPDKSALTEMFKRRGTFTIGQNRNIMQLKN